MSRTKAIADLGGITINLTGTDYLGNDVNMMTTTTRC